MTAQEFLDFIYTEENKEKATDFIFEKMDTFYRNHNFKTPNDIFEKLDTDKISVSRMRTMLVAGGWAIEDLPAAQALYRRMKRVFWFVFEDHIERKA